jgi:hypothetical protein
MEIAPATTPAIRLMVATAKRSCVLSDSSYQSVRRLNALKAEPHRERKGEAALFTA